MVRAADNPFAVHRVLRQRYLLDDETRTRLFRRLRVRQYRGAIVGPHGSGKTTLLEDVAARLTDEGWQIRWVRLSRERPSITREVGRSVFTGLSSSDIVAVDGAEQLSFARWWCVRWLTRRAGGLVITTHDSGRLPTIWQCRTSPELLRTIVAGLDQTLSPDEASNLHFRHAGNIREALRELYDRAAIEEYP